MDFHFAIVLLAVHLVIVIILMLATIIIGMKITDYLDLSGIVWLAFIIFILLLTGSFVRTSSKQGK